MVDCAEPTYAAASWKGVPFNVEESSDDFGRRGDLYEYPMSDETGYKDLGRKARKFKVEGYLIGSDQVALTTQMATAAESPEPGILIHPMYGAQMVACVTLTTKADYRKDKKRTKLSFDFLEAHASMAPFRLGSAISALFDAGSAAVRASERAATWLPTAQTRGRATDISVYLSGRVAPATDENSFDAIAMLERGLWVA